MRTRKQKRIAAGRRAAAGSTGTGAGRVGGKFGGRILCVYWQGSLGHVTHEKLVDE